MSFSSDAKEELCRIPLEKQDIVLAEAYGVLMFCNSFSLSGIRISTQSDAFALRLPELFRRAFGVEFDPREEGAPGSKRIFRITRRSALEPIMEAFGYSAESIVSHHINYALLEEEDTVTAFCRGAFLAGGSVTDPEKRYHLELATNHIYVHREFQALLPELQLNPRETRRKANYLTYFKQSDAITIFLRCIGAVEAAQKVLSTKVERSVYNGANRQYNCDVANVDKAVAAAQTQIAAIRILRERGEWEQLGEKLRETALLREENPELSLAELAECCDPPVSKSCLNHRLRRLMEMAEL